MYLWLCRKATGRRICSGIGTLARKYSNKFGISLAYSYLCNMVMDLQGFFTSLLNVVCEMAPYLLLGFFIAGVLHVFVPQRFYANYLSRNNKLSVVWAALLGVPLPLCSCGVIPTAIGLRNEKASKGVRHYPSYGGACHWRLRRIAGKPTGS